MRRSDALEALTRHEAALRALGATAIYLFGSTARDEARRDSDLDLFVDYDPDETFSLIELIKIKHFLEDRLNVAVDVTTRDSLHPRLKARIEAEAVRVL